jgi:type II secretory pathway pseudopilin PulG
MKKHPSRSNQAARTGFSLLEVALGLMIISGITALTLPLMATVVERHTQQARLSELTHLAQGKQNEYRHLTRAFANTWSPSQLNQSGSFAAEGHPSAHWQITLSQAVAHGGIPNRLLSIQTFVWDDLDGNRRYTPGEFSVSLWTAVAKSAP